MVETTKFLHLLFLFVTFLFERSLFLSDNQSKGAIQNIISPCIDQEKQQTDAHFWKKKKEECQDILSRGNHHNSITSNKGQI